MVPGVNDLSWMKSQRLLSSIASLALAKISSITSVIVEGS